MLFMLYFCSTIAVITSSSQANNNNASYVAVLPSVLRPGRGLDISVSVINTTEPIIVLARVYYNKIEIPDLQPLPTISTATTANESMPNVTTTTDTTASGESMPNVTTTNTTASGESMPNVTTTDTTANESMPNVTTTDTTASGESMPNVTTTDTTANESMPNVTTTDTTASGDSMPNVTTTDTMDSMSMQKLATRNRPTIEPIITPIVVVETTNIISQQGMISLAIPSDATRDQYVVWISGTGTNFTFEDETIVKTEMETISIFIQTDKGNYKPGKLVRLRVMAVDSNLITYKGTFDVTIEDPNKSIIKQWTNVSTSSGVFSGELQLSEQPVLGTWTIKAKTQLNAGQEKSAVFNVKEYVLPKFEVKLNLPTFILAETKKLPVSVSAKYTYGKNVKGTAILSIQIKSSYWQSRNYNYKIINRTLELTSGMADTSFTREELLYLAGTRQCSSALCYANDPCVTQYAEVNEKLMYQTLLIGAVITEDLTGKNFSATATVSMQPFPVEMKFSQFSPNMFKPGLTWTGMIEMKRTDNTALIASDYMNGLGKPNSLTVKFTCTNRTYYTTDEITKNYTINKNGLMEIKFTPSDSSINCNLQARYKYAKAYKRIKMFSSSEGHSIQVTAPDLTGNIKVGSQVSFIVTTSQTTEGFYYQILSKGLIVDTQYITSDGKNTTTFSVYFDKRFCRKTSPHGRIIVWYLTTNAEFIVDTMNFNVDGIFENNVTLEFSTGEVKPGADMSLTVNAAAGSYVALLAVDQSVLLMGAGNDINQDQIVNDLRRYDSSRYYRGFYNRYSYNWWWPRYSSASTTAEVIGEAGVSVLTDASIYDYSTFYYPRPMGLMASSDSSSARMESSSSARQYSAKSSYKVPLKEPVKVRNEFPETWIWADEVVGPDGKVTLQMQVPDTLTSWMASAFALSDTAGMGVTKNMAKVTVFKPFFVSLNLPYSVIRGEEVALQVTVFNYLQHDIQVVVTIEGSDKVKIQHPNDILPSAGTDVEKSISVPASDGVLVSFWIIPVMIGQTLLSVKARSAVAADHVQRMLLVKPEGEFHEYTRSVLVNNIQNSTHSESMTIKFPPNGVVPDSQRAIFTVIGNTIGPSINGLDQLLRMPYGCGEQNIVKFAPNVYILMYLESVNMLTSAIKNKALHYLETGYQRQLTYRRNEGSFSAFGNADYAGSTWLTAFVIRSFTQAKPYINIDQKIIDTSAMWIVKNQDKSGAFLEPPHSHAIMSRRQGSSSKGLDLTAYVVATLLEIKDHIADNQTRLNMTTAIDNALNQIESLLPNISSDAYSLSIVTYALTLANRTTSNVSVAALDALATVKGNNKYWKEIEPERKGPVPYWYRYYPAPSKSIEMTAYALLTYTRLNMITEGIPVASWLASQRNRFGGYRSTQDTVIGLMALSMFESKVGLTDMQDMEVSLVVDYKSYMFPKITTNNGMVLQSYEISSPITKVDMYATGTGVAMFQMSIQYHQTQTDDLSGIDLNVTSDTNDIGEVITKACGTWLHEEDSGMVVLQMNQLTAYQPLTDTIITSNSTYSVRRHEIDDRTLTLYLDELPHNEEVCITVTSVNTSPVSNLQPAVVLIYPYYNPENQKSAFYLPKKLTKTMAMCDSCPECCNDNCLEKPCMNGGQCIDDNILNTYKCQCTEGFTGKNCQHTATVKVSAMKDRTGTSAIQSPSFLLAALIIFIKTLLL